MELANGATNHYGMFPGLLAASQGQFIWEEQAHSGDRRRTDDDGRGVIFAIATYRLGLLQG